MDSSYRNLYPYAICHHDVKCMSVTMKNHEQIDDYYYMAVYMSTVFIGCNAFHVHRPSDSVIVFHFQSEGNSFLTVVCVEDFYNIIQLVHDTTGHSGETTTYKKVSRKAIIIRSSCKNEMYRLVSVTGSCVRHLSRPIRLLVVTWCRPI